MIKNEVRRVLKGLEVKISVAFIMVGIIWTFMTVFTYVTVIAPDAWIIETTKASLIECIIIWSCTFIWFKYKKEIVGISNE